MGTNAAPLTLFTLAPHTLVSQMDPPDTFYTGSYYAGARKCLPPYTFYSGSVPR